MGSKVKTVKIIDDRILPQNDPVFAVAVGPEQLQNYRIPASGLGNSYINFNNLTTLGADRAYVDSFEVEITATVTFHLSKGGQVHSPDDQYNVVLPPSDWTFDSFPFNKCCDEIRVNINGGSFFSYPLSYLRAKERYWSDKKILKSYGSAYPCVKAHLANEMGYSQSSMDNYHEETFKRIPSRLSPFNYGYAFTPFGLMGSTNKDMTFPYFAETEDIASPIPDTKTFTVTWREPIFCSPFSSRVDATYGRALYNITSLDITFQLQDLRNMIRCKNKYVAAIDVNIDNCNLLYQVATIPRGIPPPEKTIVPYRRFVPYITDYPANPVPYLDGKQSGNRISLTSGVYTLSTVPEAIWLFIGPTKNLLMTDPHDGWEKVFYDGTTQASHTWSFNKTFACIDKISITCSNTTQILNTYTDKDLYRIAKANGCQDTWVEWGRQTYPIQSGFNDWVNPTGSVLRLIPGVDIVVDTPLIPGASAKNAVFQATVEAYIPAGFPPNYRDVALWILFEYNGVATIAPESCTIDLNPLSASAPTGITLTPDDAINNLTSPSVEGSGWWENIKKIASTIGDVAKETKFASRLAKYIPVIGPAASTVLGALGYGQIGGKRPRTDDDFEGGAVMGYGDFC